jgi:hypothetical protein
VFFFEYNMTATPDGISQEQLQSLLSKAPKETSTVDQKALFDGMTEDQLCDISAKYLTAAQDDCRHPMVHKVMALTILRQFIEWHTELGTRMMSEEPEQAVGWLRDAGKLQAAYSDLLEVCLDEHDFTCD